VARASNRRLKVFEARIGFYDTVVAAPSQAAALRAWDVHQNLFADGQAKLTDDSQAVEAALAHPQTPLRRAAGSGNPFSLDPAGLPKIPDIPRKPLKRPTKSRAVRPRPPADRSALDEAETAIRKLEDDRKREAVELRRRQDALDAEVAAARSAYVVARKATTTAAARARENYRKAGGAD
jgi:hypothetical protein